MNRRSFLAAIVAAPFVPAVTPWESKTAVLRGVEFTDFKIIPTSIKRKAVAITASEMQVSFDYGETWIPWKGDIPGGTPVRVRISGF